MTDNLRNLKKELKAFAKRVKDFKYTDSALITFLLTGMLGITGFTVNLYSAEDEIKTQEHAINTSILQLQKDFKRARQENNKLLRTTNLELIQLMEQGDHVVKSPWSSWQYGMNYVNNNWNGEYKGRGDKVKDVKYTRSTGMDKYQYQRRGQLSYGGSTDITFPIEPNAAIPIAAALKPITPLAKNANLALNVDLSGLPAFEPTTVIPPVIPTIKAPEPKLSINVSVSGPSRGSNQHTYAFYDTAGAWSGIVENVSVGGGTIKIERTGPSTYSYEAKNVKIGNIGGGSVTGVGSYGNTITNHSNTSANAANAFFQVRGADNHSGLGITINGSNIDYKVISGHSDLNELVHQDVHGGSSYNDVKTAVTNAIGSDVPNLNLSVIDDIQKTNAFATKVTTIDDHYNVFANGGVIDVSGVHSVLVNSYNHGGGNGVVINGGTINLNGNDTNRAVFLLSPDTNNNNNIQYYYNTGTINVNTSQLL